MMLISQTRKLRHRAGANLFKSCSVHVVWCLLCARCRARLWDRAASRRDSVPALGELGSVDK